MNTTVIYITNNKLDPKIDALCKKHILESTRGLRLISVSQEPIDFGENLVVGQLPPSSLSINIQMMEGLKRVETDFVAIAEHDCLYTQEHFNWTPPDKEKFYYNENIWCLQYYSEDKPEANGTFSIFPNRKANSQLICGTKSMIQSTQERIDMMSDPAWLEKYPKGRIGEAGAMEVRHARKLASGESVAHIRSRLIDYCTKYEGVNFKTNLPNVDIRHNMNLTKNRRANKRRNKINHWGTMEDIFYGS